MPDRIFSIIVAGTEVTVTRKSIRNAYIRVVPPYGEVRVSVPEYMKDGEITAFVGSKMSWIRSKQKKYEGYEPHLYVSGETVHLWGERMTLELIEDSEKRRRFSYSASDGKIMIHVPENLVFEQRKSVFDAILKAETIKKMESLIGPLENRTGLHAAEWKTRNMTSRWGSCKPGEKKITISTRLAAYPEECLEEVMIHELCHLKAVGHGKDFYALMDRFYPEWKTVRELLKKQMI